jgi:tetratricopeptide (TPR) repeat protein
MLNLGLQQELRQAHALIAQGNFAPALTITNRLLKSAPNDSNVLLYRSMAQRGLGQFDEARRSLEKILAKNPRHHAALNDLALTLSKMQRWSEAHKAIDLAAALLPDDPTIAAVKAGLCFSTGDFERCAETLDRFASRGIESPQLAITGARLAPRIGKEHEAADRLERCLKLKQVAPATRATMLFMLGDLRDKLGEIDAAFEAYSQANMTRAERFDPVDHDRRVSRLIGLWTRETIAAVPQAKADGSRCVFIVGMPRSATSLVEQILASHPKAAGAGELNDLGKGVHALEPTMTHLVPMLLTTTPLNQATMDRFAREYLATIRQVSMTASRISDKMPMNFFHLGLIQRLLPGARVIHCVRNPIDTCWSCFTQNFSGNNPFSFNLRHVGAFYRAYSRIMTHWASTLDLPMMDMVYEDLLADPEAHVRRMLEFLALPWDDRCMKFHENKRVVITASQDQVRRPLFQSSKARWKKYEKHLGPLIESLGDLAYRSTR